MLRIFLAIAALVAVTSGEFSIRPRLDGRIVGGVEVDITDVPYQLSLLMYGTHICGASIIGWNFAITAAHCTDGLDIVALSVRAGSSIRNSGGKVYAVSRKYQHPSYNANTVDYDVTVLVLKDELSFGPGVNSIAIPASSSTPLPVGSAALVSGWGALSENGASATQLNAVTVTMISNEECGTYYGQSAITGRMCCAGVPEGGKDACQGDSGGPLVVDGVLVGIVSWGIGCARPNYPGVYTSVAGVRDFIREAINI